MCGGFTYSKNALIVLNIIYVIISFILIGVAAYARASSIITSLPIIGGIISCGVFLLFISLVGLIGAIKHHQVLLFVYMIVLVLLFIIQFSVACACLALDRNQQEIIARKGWIAADNATKSLVQSTFGCCGFNSRNSTVETSGLEYPSCGEIDECCTDPKSKKRLDKDQCCVAGDGEVEGGDSTSCFCEVCLARLNRVINHSFQISGGFGLFFSFTEILGIIFSYQLRKQLKESV